MKKSILMVPVLAGGLLTNSASAAVPLSFTHHGVLKEDGNLVNGSRKITATIVDDAGNEAGSQTATVDVTAGHYTMVIENIDPQVVVGAGSLNLKINVEGDDLNPPLVISSDPYALAAEHAVVADNVVCHGCITPDHLSFNALQDSALPNCGENQVLRQGAGSVWECSDVVNLDNASGQAVVHGRVGINTSEFGFGLFTYNKILEMAHEVDAGIEACACDKGGAGFDCPDSFSTKEDNGQSCYDIFGPTYNIYERSAIMAPLSDVVVIDNGAIGIGTGRPAAPIHVRTMNGAAKYEAILADTQPEVLFEDLDGSNFAVAVKDGALAVSTISDGVTDELMTLNNEGLTVAGSIRATSMAQDFIIGKANVDFNYAASKSKGGAASSIEDNIVTSAKIKDGTISNADIADATISKGKLATAVQTSLGLADTSIQKTTGSVTSAYILDKTVATVDLADGAVTSAKIYDGTIATDDLADGSVTSAKILDGTIATADLADGSVNSAKILDGTIATADLANSSVTSLKIQDGTIATADLANGAVTTDKVNFSWAKGSSKGGNAAQADNSTYAGKIGTSGSHPAIGSTSNPVYVDSTGTIKAVTMSSLSVGSATNATNATYASNIISSTTNIGSSTQPVYILNGKVTAGTSYDNATVAVAKDVQCSAAGCINGTELAPNAITTSHIQDGKVTAAKLDKASVLDMIYPVGSIYISYTNASASTISTLLGGTWVALDNGYYLVNSTSSVSIHTVSACLPNIKGTYGASELTESNRAVNASGALYDAGEDTSNNWNASGDKGGSPGKIGFDASRYNSIYSDSCSTVQPKSIKVYMFRRTN